MIVWFAILFAITLWRVKFLRRTDPLSREHTNCVNAFFVIFIMLNHAKNYFYALGYCWTNEPFAFVLDLFMRFVSQLCVVSFLFFSGFGIGERIANGGIEYLRHLPSRRILPFVINSLPVAVVWLFLGMLFAGDLTSRDVFAQIAFWDGIRLGPSIGPCWYNFCIVILWLLTFSLGRLGGGWLAVGVVGFSLLLWQVKGDLTYWYDTLWVFPMGFLFSRRKDFFLKLIDRKYWLLLGGTVAAVVFFRLSFCLSIVDYLRIPHVIWHNVLAIVFSGLIVIVMQRVCIGNPILDWVGKRIFAFYMYHGAARVLMWLVLSQAGMELNRLSVHLVILSSFALTILGARHIPLFRGFAHGNG